MCKECFNQVTKNVTVKMYILEIFCGYQVHAVVHGSVFWLYVAVYIRRGAMAASRRTKGTGTWRKRIDIALRAGTDGTKQADHNRDPRARSQTKTNERNRVRCAEQDEVTSLRSLSRADPLINHRHFLGRLALLVNGSATVRSRYTHLQRQLRKWTHNANDLARGNFAI